MRNGMVQVMSELKNNALNYAKKGFKIFPLKPNTKGEQVLRCPEMPTWAAMVA